MGRPGGKGYSAGPAWKSQYDGSWGSASVEQENDKGKGGRKDRNHGGGRQREEDWRSDEEGHRGKGGKNDRGKGRLMVPSAKSMARGKGGDRYGRRDSPGRRGRGANWEDEEMDERRKGRGKGRRTISEFRGDGGRRRDRGERRPPPERERRRRGHAPSEANDEEEFLEEEAFLGLGVFQDEDAADMRPKRKRGVQSMARGRSEGGRHPRKRRRNSVEREAGDEDGHSPSAAAAASSQSGSEASGSESSSSSEGEDWRQMVWDHWQRQCAAGAWNGGMMGGHMMPPPGPPQWQQNNWKGGPPPPQPRTWSQQDANATQERRGKGGKRGYGKGAPEVEREEEARERVEAAEAGLEEEPREVPIFLDESVTEFVPVPKALIAKIIGKKASTIKDIRLQSGCHRVDARDQMEDPVQVKIEGTEESVKKAKEIIMNLIENPNERLLGEHFVEIPKANVGKVIGLRGAQINAIQAETRVKIDIDFKFDPCKVYVKGEPDCVELAKNKILEIAMLLDDGQAEYVDLPRHAAGVVIGIGGSRLREFQDATGARIDVDKTGNICRVRLSGDAEAVLNAKQLIFAKIEECAPAGKGQKGPGIFKGEFAPPAMKGFKGAGKNIVAAQQPTSFPASIQESIARAKAAAQAVNEGLLAEYPDSWWEDPNAAQADGMLEGSADGELGWWDTGCAPTIV